MAKIFRSLGAALAGATLGVTFSISSCVERLPPEWVECLRNCNP